VLTGGSSTMHGMVELGEEIFHMPVRLGLPRHQGGLAEVLRNPRYATGMGLLLEGASQVQHGQLSRQSGSVTAVLARMREWFQRNF
jgi:cell division protein FtsA